MTGKKTRTSSAAGTSKKARTTTKATNAALENEEEETLTLSVEKDALECDICFLPFESEVFMCKNGHSGCAKCCLRADGKCWSCPERIGDIRCRPLEKLLAAATTSCKFKRNGCSDNVRYLEKLSHEKTCQHAPYECPIDGCTYSGLRLGHHVAQDHGLDYNHNKIYKINVPSSRMFSTRTISSIGTAKTTVHKDEPFRLLLERDSERVFLLLNGRDLLQGRSLSLLCLGPRPVCDGKIEYTMKVSGGVSGALTLSASGTILFARRLEWLQDKGFLFVPDEYWGSTGSISVSISVYVWRRRRPMLVEKLSNDETCWHAPYHCPIDGCTYIGQRLCHHVAQEHGSDGLVSRGFLFGTAVTVHKDEPFRLLLLPDCEHVFVLLNGRDLLQGRSLSLLCLGPRPVCDEETEYEMKVSGGVPGTLSLSASGTMPFAQRLEGFRAKWFLFVPDAYWRSTGTVSVIVRV